MKVERHHYNPTPEQTAALKRRAAEFRGRTRAMRALRETISGFNMVGLDVVKAEKAASKFVHGYVENGWPDSAAGELAAYHFKNHGAAL